MSERDTPILPAMLTPEQTAELLAVEPQTLAKWRLTGRWDLPFVRIGRRIRYRRGDVLAWIEKNTVGAAD